MVPAEGSGSTPGPGGALSPIVVKERGPLAPSTGNELLAEVFKEMAVILKLKRDRFRARAFEKAAQTIGRHSAAIQSGAQAKSLEGIGAGMAKRIDIVLETGELEELAELKKDPDVIALRSLRSVHGVGPVRAAELLGKGIRSLEELRAAAATGKVKLDSQQTIGLKYAAEFAKRIPRSEMQEHEALLLGLRDGYDSALILTVCGSYRRGQADCGDIDALITSRKFTSEGGTGMGSTILKGFVGALRDAGYVTDTLVLGQSKFMGVCTMGPGALHRRIDIRCIPHDQYHFATLYFTGNTLLNIKLRTKAIELGMTLSEYGLESKSSAVPKTAATCARDIFDALQEPYLEPHQR